MKGMSDMTGRIQVRDLKCHVIRVRLGAYDLAKARRLAKYLTKGNISGLIRFALQNLFEEKENVLHVYE